MAPGQLGVEGQSGDRCPTGWDRGTRDLGAQRTFPPITLGQNQVPAPAPRRASHPVGQSRLSPARRDHMLPRMFGDGKCSVVLAGSWRLQWGRQCPWGIVALSQRAFHEAAGSGMGRGGPFTPGQDGQQGVLAPSPLCTPDPQHPLTEPLLAARHWVDTLCINKILFWPVCVPASAKSWFEATSDKN